jgi:hypothetical protein
VKHSASPTPNAWVGQGRAWTNLGDSFGATYRTEHGWPRDAFRQGHDRAVCDHRAVER